VQDGLELTWAVNVAAPFLLTACLLGALRGRVVTVASISAASSIDFGNLQQVREGRQVRQRAQPTVAVQLAWRAPPRCGRLERRHRRAPGPAGPGSRAAERCVGVRLQERGYSAHGAYALSKLADIMFSTELAARLQAAGSAVTSNSLDPGDQVEAVAGAVGCAAPGRPVALGSAAPAAAAQACFAASAGPPLPAPTC
jgi:NAD(P)-dependent dehydrogenase (short-subunit alcohol dehydrogenase family)